MHTMKLKEVTNAIEEFAPLYYQESYDNSGLLIGDKEKEVHAVLLCVDVTDAVISEAIELGCDLIISHHPLIFSGLKRITGTNDTQRMVLRLIENRIAVYASHTNMDNVEGGVSFKMGEKLGLLNMRVLVPRNGDLQKLAIFVPNAYAEHVRNAIFERGAGAIGNYSECSFNVSGEGTFKAGKGSHPFVGERGKRHIEPETKIECIVTRNIAGKIIEAAREAHPYEEMAYDIFTLDNLNSCAGTGAVGELPEPVDTRIFLQTMKDVFGCGVIRHTRVVKDKIQRVALCGGAGASFAKEAIKANADIYISADFKYHDFFGYENGMMVADIGHFESEKFAIDIFYEILMKKLTNFAVYITKHVSNPIIYL